ncbi:MAG TPA: hypothetical protein VHP33_21165 [Polyangiaceae bacterium]|nr:hypothetical protein [Polyangiaceae bacterium]
MSYAGISWLKLDWCRALLLVVLPTACAVGVDPTFDGSGADPDGTAGTSTAAGGTLGTSGSGSVLPKAGTTGTAGSAVVNPFGGSASAGTSSGGTSAAGTSAGGASSAGASSGGSAGAAGKGGSAGAGAGAGGSGTGGCACTKTLTWKDNTVLAWAAGDCVDVSGAKYLYTGTKAQTYANGQCNPAKQEAWCADSSNDYKFMLCQ